MKTSEWIDGGDLLPGIFDGWMRWWNRLPPLSAILWVYDAGTPRARRQNTHDLYG